MEVGKGQRCQWWALALGAEVKRAVQPDGVRQGAVPIARAASCVTRRTGSDVKLYPSVSEQ